MQAQELKGQVWVLVHLPTCSKMGRKARHTATRARLIVSSPSSWSPTGGGRGGLCGGGWADANIRVRVRVCARVCACACVCAFVGIYNDSMHIFMADSITQHMLAHILAAIWRHLTLQTCCLSAVKCLHGSASAVNCLHAAAQSW